MGESNPCPSCCEAVVQATEPPCHTFFFQSSVADLPLTLAFSPSFHAIVLLHLLHVAMFEYFCANCSHTFDRVPFGIFSVERLMASSVCACSVKCCMLFTVKTVAMKTPMSVSDTGKVYIGSWGSFTCAPRNLPSDRVQLAQAPKSALHFGPGRYRLYWNRFHIGSGSRYPTLRLTHRSRISCSSHTHTHTHTHTTTHLHTHTHTHTHTLTNLSFSIAHILLSLSLDLLLSIFHYLCHLEVVALQLPIKASSRLLRCVCICMFMCVCVWVCVCVCVCEWVWL